MRVVNRHRLGMAMGVGPAYQWIIPDDWPLHRCHICGRLNSPLDDERFIHTVSRGRPRLMCLQHSGSKSSIVCDCLTAEQVGIPKSPPLARKFIGDLLHENWYWFRVAVRYVWFTIKNWLLYVTHPVRAIGMIKLCREAGWDWW